MSLAIVPAAGRASRLGHRAPLGCKLLVRLPSGELMVDYLQRLLAPAADEVRFVVRDNVMDDQRLAGFQIVVDDSLAGSLHAVKDGGGLEADDLLVWYADTLASEVPDGTDWVGISYAKTRRPWELPIGPSHYTRKIVGPGIAVCAGAYRFAHPLLLERCETMLEALNTYPGLWQRVLPGWEDLDDVTETAEVS